MKEQDVLSQLKLRLGYGLVGNQNIDDFAFYTLYDAKLEDGKVTYVPKGRRGTKDITWESQRQFNVGVDMGFLNGRITASLDAFLIKNKDLLMTRSLPLTSGFSSAVENIGETDFIVTYEEQDGKGGIIHGVKIVAVVLISFFGAAFSTMAFNNDVGVTRMFGQVYELLTGTKSDGFTILEFTYCIGIVIGILTFFNHFGKKRLSVDPTPMEVEMRLYENDIQTTLVETYSRREKEQDVGEKHMSGTTGI